MWCGRNKWKGCHTWPPSLWACHWIWWNTMVLCDLVFDIVLEMYDVVTSWESITSWFDQGIYVVGSFLVYGRTYFNLLEQQSRTPIFMKMMKGMLQWLSISAPVPSKHSLPDVTREPTRPYNFVPMHFQDLPRMRWAGFKWTFVTLHSLSPRMRNTWGDRRHQRVPVPICLNNFGELIWISYALSKRRYASSLHAHIGLPPMMLIFELSLEWLTSFSTQTNLFSMQVFLVFVLRFTFNYTPLKYIGLVLFKKKPVHERLADVAFVVDSSQHSFIRLIHGLCYWYWGDINQEKKFLDYKESPIFSPRKNFEILQLLLWILLLCSSYHLGRSYLLGYFLYLLRLKCMPINSWNFAYDWCLVKCSDIWTLEPLFMFISLYPIFTSLEQLLSFTIIKCFLRKCASSSLLHLHPCYCPTRGGGVIH